MIFPPSEDALKLITDQTTGTISIVHDSEEGEGVGINYENINVFITDRQYFGNNLSIKFAVIDDPKFFTERITTYHPADTELYKKIQTTYPGKSEGISNTGNIRTESDVPDVLLFQNNETNYEFNKRLCCSYKKDSIFAYGWEGLLIKDIMGEYNHLGNKDPDENLTVFSGDLVSQAQPYGMSFNKKKNFEPFNPWENNGEENTDSTTQGDFTEFESKYVRTIMNYQGYNIVGKDLEPYLRNQWSNSRKLNNPNNILEITLTSIPAYKLGDVITYSRASQEESIPWTKYLIASNEIFFTVESSRRRSKRGFRFEWTSKLIGLEEVGNINKEPEKEEQKEAQ